MAYDGEGGAAIGSFRGIRLLPLRLEIAHVLEDLAVLFSYDDIVCHEIQRAFFRAATTFASDCFRPIADVH